MTAPSAGSSGRSDPGPAPDPPAPADRVASDDRLRNAEVKIAELRGEIGDAPRERIAKIEAMLPSLATTTDLERAKRWVIVGVVSAAFSVLAPVVRILTWFFDPPTSPP